MSCPCHGAGMPRSAAPLRSRTQSVAFSRPSRSAPPSQGTFAWRICAVTNERVTGAWASGTTGRRRSEILHSHIDDIDFEIDQVMLRERKRRKHLAGSTRFVPLHPRLRTILDDWFSVHPGGQFTITCAAVMPRRKPKDGPQQLTMSQARHHFRQTLRKSKWRVLRGFHVLRHSFGSNLVRSGRVPRSVVGEWMGHTTEEMRELYQHLFPQDGLRQISVLR